MKKIAVANPVDVRQNKFVLDEGPDDAGHFIAVELDDWVGYSNFFHDSAKLLDIELECLTKIVKNWIFFG